MRRCYESRPASRIESATFADEETQAFTIWQTRGLPDLSVEGSQANPAALFYASDTVSAVTDPLNRTREYDLDRFAS